MMRRILMGKISWIFHMNSIFLLKAVLQLLWCAAGEDAVLVGYQDRSHSRACLCTTYKGCLLEAHR